MEIRGISNPIDIAISGLRVESTRMNVIAENIANSSTSRTANGEPYRRQDLLLSTDGDGFNGVRLQDIVTDTRTDFRQIHQPGHPDADANGFVRMPNVELPIEMMNLVSASRAYEANAAVMKQYKEMMDVAIELLR